MMQDGRDVQPQNNSARSRSWLGYGLTLGGILLFMLPLGVGVREIIREVPSPTLQPSPAGLGPIDQTINSDAAQTSVPSHLQFTTPPTAASATSTTATSATTRTTGLPMPQKEAGFTPNGFTGFQRIQDQYLDYLNRKGTLDRDQAFNILKTLNDRIRNVDQAYFAFLREHKIPMPGDQWSRICNFRDRLRNALDLEPVILDQDWESAAYYCRSQPYSYRWETELYFLKKMGPRGYLMILKRAPQHWWEEFQWGKLRKEIRAVNGDPRY